MKTMISALAPMGVRVRRAPPVAIASPADIARAELRASLADAIAKGRAALVGVR